MRITQSLKIGGIFVSGVVAAMVTVGFQRGLSASSGGYSSSSPSAPSSAVQSLSLSNSSDVWVAEDMRYGISAKPYDQDELSQQFVFTNVYDSPITGFYAFPDSHIDGQANEKIMSEELLWPEESTTISFENSWQSCTYDFIVFYADMTMTEDIQVDVCQ